MQILIFLLALVGCHDVTRRKVLCPAFEVPFSTQYEENVLVKESNFSNLLDYIEGELVSQGFEKNKGDFLDYYSEEAVLLSAFVIDDPLEKYLARKLQAILFFEKLRPNVLYIQFVQRGFLTGGKSDSIEYHCKNLIEQICKKYKLKVIKVKQKNIYYIEYELGKSEKAKGS